MPPETRLPTRIRARVHEDAINRVTRFFNATTVETLNELFQNARRAGASKVEVAIADDKVRVRDDGRGIPDPSTLLAFGHTGWDPETKRREDPAGMGIYSLARRPHVTIASRPRPVDGAPVPAWKVHLTPEHFLGHEAATVERIDKPELPFGTEIVFDEEKANVGDVNVAAQYFPVPVSCNGEGVKQGDFLHDAVYVEQWQGIRLGARHSRYSPGRRYELNFHGIPIEGLNLPYISAMTTYWHVDADVVDCASLELVLPARKSIVETPFVDELRHACRGAIYRAMLETEPEIAVPATVHADALEHGVKLPIPHARLEPWRPRFSDRYARDAESPDATNLPDDPIVIHAEIPICDQHALWRAAQRANMSHRLYAEEPRYEGYDWYDKLPRATKLTTTVRIEGNEEQIEKQRRECNTPATCRPEAITFTLETIEHDGTTGRISIPGDVAFPNDETDCAEDLRMLVTTDSSITPEKLAQLLYDAFFYPSDEPDAESYETQREDYHQGVFANALKLLASEEEAMLSNIRNAVQRTVMYHVPRDKAVTIHINGREPIEITIDNAA